MDEIPELPLEAYDLIFKYTRYCDQVSGLWTIDDFKFVYSANESYKKTRTMKFWQFASRYPIINLSRTCKTFNELFTYQYNKWLATFQSR